MASANTKENGSLELTYGLLELDMFTENYQRAVDYIAELAPSLDAPTKYFMWVEDIVSLLSFIYNRNPDDVMQELTDQVKLEQGFESEDEDEDEE